MRLFAISILGITQEMFAVNGVDIHVNELSKIT